jgi:uncharacterized protein YozE (UPF0346 family)
MKKCNSDLKLIDQNDFYSLAKYFEENKDYNKSLEYYQKYFYKQKMPFVKKLAFSRHNGALGRQLLYILKHTNPDTRDTILTCARRVYDDKYISTILTRNPLKIMWRNIRYTIHKLRTEGI